MVKSYRGVGLAAVVVVVAWGWSAEAQQSLGPQFGGSAGQLITYLVPSTDGKPTALTIVEPATKRIAVYHIDRASGEIQLKSLRNIAGDLELDYWNSGSPLPHEIIQGLERKGS